MCKLIDCGVNILRIMVVIIILCSTMQEQYAYVHKALADYMVTRP